MKRTLSKIARVIDAHASFLIGGHERPDGDAIGSALALRHAISRRGKRATVVARSGIPRHYRFLPGADQVVRDVAADAHEVVIAVDCDGRQRFDGPPQALDAAQVVVNIDHHGGEAKFGDLNVVDQSAAATGQLVLRLLDEMAVELDPTIATCLYCAIGTDTGFFRFPNTTPSVLEAAARLVRAGAAPDVIAAKSWDEKSIEAMSLLGRALSSIESRSGGRLLVAQLSPRDFAEARADSQDTEGIIERIKFTAGSEVAALLRDEGRGKVYVSLRSSNGVDVRGVAQNFGGGGHPSAAGFTMQGDLATVRAALLPELEALLDSPAS